MCSKQDRDAVTGNEPRYVDKCSLYVGAATLSTFLVVVCFSTCRQYRAVKCCGLLSAVTLVYAIPCPAAAGRGEYVCCWRSL